MSRMLLNSFSGYVCCYFPKYSQLLLLWKFSVHRVRVGNNRVQELKKKFYLII